MTDHPILVHKHSRYASSTTVPNVTLQDQRLSWAARGLLAYMLSLPEDWQLNERHLIGQSPAGRDHLRGIVRELEALGYMRRSVVRGAKGRILQSVWEVWCSTDHEPQNDLSPLTDFPSEARTVAAEGELPLTAFPATDKPATDKPATENPSYYKENNKQTKQGTRPALVTSFVQELTAATSAEAEATAARTQAASKIQLPPCAQPHRELVIAWWKARTTAHPTAPRHLTDRDIAALEHAAALGVLVPFLQRAAGDRVKSLGYQYRQRCESLLAGDFADGFAEFRAAYLAARKRASSQSISRATAEFSRAVRSGITAAQITAALRREIQQQQQAEQHGGFAACLPDMFRWLRDRRFEAYLAAPEASYAPRHNPHAMIPEPLVLEG